MSAGDGMAYERRALKDVWALHDASAAESLALSGASFPARSSGPEWRWVASEPFVERHWAWRSPDEQAAGEASVRARGLPRMSVAHGLAPDRDAELLAHPHRSGLVQFATDTLEQERREDREPSLSVRPHGACGSCRVEEDVA